MNPLQQQSQSLRSALQESKHQQASRADKKISRPEKPLPTSVPERASKLQKMLSSGEAPQDKRSCAGPRERPTKSVDTAGMMKRKVTTGEPAYQEASLFSQLLEDARGPAMMMGGTSSGDFCGLTMTLDKTPPSGASPMAAWRQLESALSGKIDTQPVGPLSLTLLLPKLGEVDARIGGESGAAGWDISLRFAPHAMAMMAPYHERCRESLRRRMAGKVRLRFEQRGAMA